MYIANNTVQTDKKDGKAKSKAVQKKRKAAKDESDSDDDVQDRMNLYVQQKTLRPLRKFRTKHWEAVAAVAQAMATGNWTVRGDGSSDSSESSSDGSDSDRATPPGKKQRRK